MTPRDPKPNALQQTTQLRFAPLHTPKQTHDDKVSTRAILLRLHVIDQNVMDQEPGVGAHDIGDLGEEGAAHVVVVVMADAVGVVGFARMSLGVWRTFGGPWSGDVVEQDFHVVDIFTFDDHGEILDDKALVLKSMIYSQRIVVHCAHCRQFHGIL